MTTTRKPAVMMAGMSSAKGRALGALRPSGILHATHLAERYKDRPAIVAWQVEHEAEYWLLRQQHGDPSYLGAFARILDRASEDGC
jgi:hypothetical protein